MPITKYCLTCGKEFKVPPVRSSAKYCCHPCSVKSGKDSPIFTQETLECKECGKVFSRKKSQIKKSKNSYCSRACNGKASGKTNSESAFRKRIVKHCIVCKKEIRVKPSHVDIEGTYCSTTCMSIDYKTRLIKHNNPNFSHGKSHVAGHYQRNRKNAKGSYEKDYPEKLYKLQR